MSLSSGREAILQATLRAWDALSIPLIKEYSGIYSPVEQGIGDDLGLFYFVPLLARTFHLSLEQSLWWWDFLTLGTGALIAFAGFWQLTKQWPERVVAGGGSIAMALVAGKIGNLYALPFFTLSFVPWAFVLVKHPTGIRCLSYFFFMGIVIAFSDSIRMYAGLSLGVMLLFLVFTKIRSPRTIILCIATVGMGYSLYTYWFSSILKNRDAILQAQGYPLTTAVRQHVFWHNIYLGLGFISNDLDLYYADPCAGKIVRTYKAAHPEECISYCSFEYDQILKGAVISVCKNHFQYVVRTLFAKAGILFFYLLIFANIGLICAWFFRKPWWIELTYWLGLTTSALPGLLTIPIAPYLVGFFTVATFYGIHSILWALQHGLVRRFRKVILSEKPVAP